MKIDISLAQKVASIETISASETITKRKMYFRQHIETNGGEEKGEMLELQSWKFILYCIGFWYYNPTFLYAHTQTHAHHFLSVESQCDSTDDAFE